MIIVRLLSPGPWLVGTTKVYPGVGADIVMESISLIDVPKGMFLHQKRVNECNRDFAPIEESPATYYSRLALIVDSLVVKVSTFPSCSMAKRYF